MIDRPDTVLVVVDAQRAFVDPDGSLARAFGAAEVSPGIAAFGRLRAYLAERDTVRPVIFIRSEFVPGQFSGGDLAHPLADLCVPGRNVDCEWAAGLRLAPTDHIVTKHDTDADASEAYRRVIDHLVSAGAKEIVLVGFQFTTCVAASALSTWQRVRAYGVGVTVAERFCGARASSYRSGASGSSRVESTRRELISAGVLVDAAV